MAKQCDDLSPSRFNNPFPEFWNPRTTSFSKLVRAVLSLSDDAFNVLIAHGSQEFSRHASM
jgi:hypothetical protein